MNNTEANRRCAMGEFRRLDEPDYCDSCGGIDVTGMDYCPEHGARFCNGCDCPGCVQKDEFETER